MSVDTDDLAIVGIAGRFPGARNVAGFWRNLCDGVDSISILSDEELVANGVDASLLDSPRYVKAAAVLDDADRFDGDFFDVNPRDAEMWDPQQRVFLECAWHAVEDAGYVAEAFDGKIGVYAGAEISTYLLNLCRDPTYLDRVDRFQTALANDKDYLPTRVAYKLNLRGPTIAVQTACSTSLVAVHLACQALLTGDCDMALAGGVSITFPQRVGYVYQEGAITSPDGRCRPFDAAAQGTVGGNGVGVVVLKRLAEALDSGDNIRAVVKGTAVNNDGARKVGYTAPGVDGQAEVIAEAVAVAGFDVDTIGYVETHGTATPLGDPIEIAALNRAFRSGSRPAGSCPIGSVKSGIGHLGAAAGVASLIKATLAVQHGQIPPSLHFKRPNPRLMLETTPFYVNTELRGWPEDVSPRRAGVSSFGIGGCNAHVVIEEPPRAEERARAAPGRHVVVMSARTEPALDSVCAELAAHLRAHPELGLADIAYTLQLGRKALEVRRAAVCTDRDALIAWLDDPARQPVRSLPAPELDALAARWVNGEAIDWSELHLGSRRLRVSLPGYPFERRRHWIETAAGEHRAPRSGTTGEEKATLVATVVDVVTEVSGLRPEALDPRATFAELGLDSLHLMELADGIATRFSVEIPFRTLLEELSTVDLLAAHLQASLREPGPVPAPVPSAAMVDAGREHPRTLSPPLEHRATPSKLPLTPEQARLLATFTSRYNARTRASKHSVARDRTPLADVRASARFRATWKDLVYPIVCDRSSGSTLWDIDGNRYVDLAMGFGVHLFGHGPDFVREAMERQMARGIHLGPRSDLTGEVAHLICEQTGMHRVAFCNSGTEAVMAALRVARSVTGRTRVVQFAGSYHGSFDGTLARAPGPGAVGAKPSARGVAPGMVADVLVLDYDTDESLECIEREAHGLAAVLVEPVQSRRPQLQPGEFLRQLRAITERAGVALVFDEAITGFRVHPGGCQAWFGVRADLAIYAKVIGGGMPIGVLAGRSDWMNTIDGGPWSFGDDSYPSTPQTFFAGTFSKHPLTMAAAREVLTRMHEEGPGLQQRLNAVTDRWAQAINAYFTAENVPIRMRHFGSLFVFEFLQDTPFMDLFFYHLIDRGVYVWEGGTCFLSTAHTEHDLEAVVHAVEETVAELRTAGFLDTDGASSQSSTLPALPSMRPIWVQSQLGPDACAAYNECAVLRLRGPLDRDAMRYAVQTIVERHEALRSTFSPGGDGQHIHPQLPVDVPIVDLSSLRPPEREEQLQDRIRREAGEPFDLARAPLLRLGLVKLDDSEHALILVIHHLIADSWSFGILLNEMAALYSAKRRGAPADLPTPASFRDYVLRHGSTEPDERYWLEQFAGCCPYLDLPADMPWPEVRTYAGEKLRLPLPRALLAAVKSLAVAQSCTSYMTFLAGFTLLLHHVSGQEDLSLGMSSAGQGLEENKNLVGFCMDVLPIRSRLRPDETVAGYLRDVRRAVLDAHDHRGFPISALVQRLNIRRDPARIPLASVTFNHERVEAEPAFHGLTVTAETHSGGLVKSDLGVNILEGGEVCHVDWAYRTDLFTAERVRHWMEVFVWIMETMAAQPNASLQGVRQRLEAQEHRWREEADGASLQRLRAVVRR